MTDLFGITEVWKADLIELLFHFTANLDDHIYNFSHILAQQNFSPDECYGYGYNQSDVYCQHALQLVDFFLKRVVRYPRTQIPAQVAGIELIGLKLLKDF